MFPIAAKTASFETEVFVRNPNTFPLNVDVLYYEANGLPLPGLVACTMLSLGATTNVSFKLGTQCPTLATGSHFGLLVLRDNAPEKIHTFKAFSRVQHVTTNQGFSIEGFPEHVFSGRGSRVIGLKRIAAAVPPTTSQPGYQPNCFVGSLGDTLNNYSIVVQDATQTQIGTTITGSLGPYQLIRYVDILAAAGIPAPDDRTQLQVVFDNDPAALPGEPSFLAFCTEQDNLSFGADFRIATSNDAADPLQFLSWCRGTSNAACSALTIPAEYTFTNASNLYRSFAVIHHPGYVRCDIVSPQADKLEIRLNGPAPPGQDVGPAVAGGNDQSFFYYATGPRNAVVNSNGFQSFWTFDVSVRESSAPIYPVSYGIKCQFGSGGYVDSGYEVFPDNF